jgi:hypothetical protein
MTEAVPRWLSRYGKEIRGFLPQVRSNVRKWNKGASVGIVGSYGTGPAGEEQINESEHRWLSRYRKEVRDCLLQITNKRTKWSQGGSVGIVGSYGTGPAVKEQIKETEPGGSVGIVENYGTGCRRSRTRDGSGAQVAQSVW